MNNDVVYCLVSLSINKKVYLVEEDGIHTGLIVDYLAIYDDSVR